MKEAEKAMVEISLFFGEPSRSSVPSPDTIFGSLSHFLEDLSRANKENQRRPQHGKPIDVHMPIVSVFSIQRDGIANSSFYTDRVAKLSSQFVQYWPVEFNRKNSLARQTQ